MHFEKGKGVFLSGFCPPSIRAVWRGEMRARLILFLHFVRAEEVWGGIRADFCFAELHWNMIY